MDSIKTGGSKMAPMLTDQSERSNLLTIEAIGVCRTLVIEGSPAGRFRKQISDSSSFDSLELVASIRLHSTKQKLSMDVSVIQQIKQIIWQLRK